jgi:FAD-linked sulfhydryl oxidase
MSAKPLDCANPVCGSKLDLFSKALRASSSSSSSSVAAAEAPRACPVDRDELGRATWALLHTTAAYFPEAPGAADRAGAADLVRGLAASYPCEHCRADFRGAIAAAPPDLGSRATFAAWACRQSTHRRPPLA